MGKRELLIIVIFVAVGAVAYQLTAPPAKEGQGFSLSRVLRNARNNMNDQPIASTTTTGTIAVAASVTELRIPGTPRGVQVIGEDRRDIAYELRVESSGPDEATALDYAKRTRIRQQDMGPALSIEVDYPDEAKQWSGLTLHVPSRLSARFISGSGGVKAEHLAAVEFDRVGGLTRIEDIEGAVTGMVSGSELTVARAGSVSLTLSASRARFSQIARGLTLTTQRGGRCEVTASQGPLTIEQTNTDVLIEAHLGTVKATGSGGRVTIENPKQAVNVEVRNAPISLTMHVPVQVLALGSGERVRVWFEGAPGVTIDALASGRIDAGDFGLTPEGATDSRDGKDAKEKEQRLIHAFGGPNAPRVTLRNSRGDIVIGKRK